MEPGITKYQAAALVLDYNIYPRHQIDGDNVAKIKRALEAEEDLPPVVADVKSKRVVDGFHRVTATLQHFREEAMIDVDFRRYRSEGQMFVEAMRLNSGHGRKLSPYDMARCITLGTDLKLDPDTIASALRMTAARLNELQMRKTSIGADAKMVPIKGTARHLAGDQISDRQQEGNRRASGASQTFIVNQVINLVESDLLDTSSRVLMERIAHLSALLAPFRKSERAAS